LFVELLLESFEFDDELFLVFDLILKSNLLTEDLLHSVILTERKTGSRLDNLVKVSNFLLKIGDDLTGVLLLLLGLLDEFPGLINLTLENSDG